jgi:ornithine cyclodeaminase/alanine dehydrogenase-like protein (mu-crystallin family)
MKPTPPALLLSRSDLGAVLTLDDCIAVVEAAFAAHARGETLGTGLFHGDGVGGEFHIKAGGLRTPTPVYACKVNGGFFQNPARHGLPAIQGLILLYDATNGVPLAVAESGLITQLRTGAATAVAAKHLARRDAGVVTLCGAGLQGAMQLRALRRVRPPRLVHVWDCDAGRSVEFAGRLAAELGLDVRPAADLGSAARASDIIVTCTPARRWYLGREHVSPGAFISAIGADSPDKQEIEPALLATSTVFCDLVGQCAEVGDLHHALAAGLMTRQQVRGELGAVIAGLVAGRTRDDEVVVFDATGTALQDVAALAAAYERAIATGRGTRFAFAG